MDGRGRAGALMRAATAVCAVLLAACAGPPREACRDATPLGTRCGFANPEDVEHVPAAGMLLVSAMRHAGRHPEGGWLGAFTPETGAVRRVWPTGGATDVAPDARLGDPGCPGPPAAAGFAPHGVTAAGTTLYVVAHAAPGGAREAVEVFTITGAGAHATVAWKACIPQETGVMANDVVIAPDGEVIVTNYQPSEGLRPLVEAHLLRRPVGDVMGWRRGRGWRHVPGTAAGQPNGVAVSSDGRWLFYAETATGVVHRLGLAAGGEEGRALVGGNPDNLTWTPRGTLLVATHTGGVRFLACLFGRAPCRAPWKIDEIDPATMAVRPVFAHDGAQIGAVATALEVGPRIYLGSVFDDRIGVLARTP